MVGGNDSTAVIKYQPQDGGGYMSQIDGYHHIHCLVGDHTCLFHVLTLLCHAGYVEKVPPPRVLCPF